MFNKMLICLDGSDLAEQILPYATETAQRFDSNVILLRVIPPVSHIAAPGEPLVVLDSYDHYEKEKKEVPLYLESVVRSLREKGLKVESVAFEDEPGRGILNYARENQVDLIAIATHGRGGLGRAVFGSVADFILRESHLPMMVIRPRTKEI